MLILHLRTEKNKGLFFLNKKCEYCHKITVYFRFSVAANTVRFSDSGAGMCNM